ncbi:MAG: phosphate ABC transporter substrate-binding protein, partial [Actinomycetota bacterium]
RLAKLVALILVILLVSLVAVGCAPEKEGKEELFGTLNLAGSTTVLPLAQAVAEEFMKEHPKVRVNVQGGGSSAGIEAVSRRVVDIGNSSRDLRPEERNLGLVDHQIAIDAVTIIVHPSNPITNLTKDQVKKIFTGQITNWKDVGGNDESIQVVNRDEASGTRECFYEIALGKTNFTKNVIIQPGSGEMIATVSKLPNAIGYVSLGYITDAVKTVNYDGIEPNEENARCGKYTLQRRLHMFTKGRAKGLAKTFIDYILSSEIQERIVSEKFIPIME